MNADNEYINRLQRVAKILPGEFHKLMQTVKLLKGTPVYLDARHAMACMSTTMVAIDGILAAVEQGKEYDKYFAAAIIIGYTDEVVTLLEKRIESEGKTT